MASSTINGVGGTGSAGNSTTDALGAFRDADFLKIMLAELTSQDPMQPQETSKLVENVQKLQELANTTYQKFRSDVSWAQTLVGKDVNVQQQALTPAEAKTQTDAGLKPDVGYQSVTGRISGFRVVSEQVYVTVGDKDYPIDNIKQVVPERNDGQQLAEIANAVIGRQVSWLDDKGASLSGVAIDASFASDGSMQVRVGDQQIPYSQVTRIGAVPAR